jgi:small redox-active disulfide protein 2
MEMSMKNIKILGTGCAKCNKLYETAAEAAQQLGIEHEMEKVTDMKKFVEFGVMLTPALVVDGEVKLAGSVPSVDKMKTLLQG